MFKGNTLATLEPTDEGSIEELVEDAVKTMNEKIIASVGIPPKFLGIDYAVQKEYEIKYTTTPNSINFITGGNKIDKEIICANSESEAEQKLKEKIKSVPYQIVEINCLGEVRDYSAVMFNVRVPLVEPIKYIIINTEV